MGEFIPLGPLLTALGIMLTLSIFVERVLMVFSWIIDRVSVLKSLMAEDVVGGQRQKLARIRRALREEEILAEETPTSTDAREIEPHPDSTEPDVDFEILPYAVDDPDRVMKEFWLQKLGFVVAVAGCYYMKFSMWQLFDW
ncbi:MAG: hypothetical protein GXO78_04115 [Calditrichaeota bacterium]|nr:hypothetical protein [Calditrichota bacterium]